MLLSLLLVVGQHPAGPPSPLLAQAPTGPEPTRLHAAPDGKPEATGDAARPLSLEAAIARLPELLAAGAPGGVELILAEGRYRLTEPLVLGPEHSGTPEQPVRLLAARPRAVVLDGSLGLDPGAFEPVTDPVERSRLAPSARDAVVAQTLADPQLLAHLERHFVLPLIADGVLCPVARFPNGGSATLAPETVEPEVAPPAVPPGKSAYGVRAGHPPHAEEGRADGWLGSLDEPRGAWVRIADRDDERAGTFEQWEAELARDNRRNRLTGFLDANWLQRSQGLVAARAEDESLHLSQALAYGWEWRAGDKPFFVEGLLCELDAPGEWHYDPPTRRLYFLPPAPLERLRALDVPVAEGLLHLDGANHVHVEGLDFVHAAAGDVVRLGEGRDNLLAGCRIARSTATGVRVSGRDHRILSCDLIDLNHHVALGGGRRAPGLLEAGGNAIENCHLYQRDFRHARVGIGISGVGNVLRHCLIHNSLGQSVTVRGNDHLIELNELFNIGFAEGDGGAIYAGGDLGGYGTVYRHNFIHHLMHVPGKVERSGLHLDDLQAGATVEGNVFYKSAGKGVFMNGGAGHRIVGNLFLEGFRGVYNVGHGSARTHQRCAAIAADPEHDYRGKKEDYVGRLEAELGPRGWASEPYRSRYPTFFEVMEDAGEFGRLWPIRCEVLANGYLGNAQGDATIWSRVHPEAAAKSRIEGDHLLDPARFRNPDALDFAIADPEARHADLPFGRIGLYTDRHRPRAPDPDRYRRSVAEFFADVSSMPGTTRRFDSSIAVERALRVEPR